MSGGRASEEQRITRSALTQVSVRLAEGEAQDSRGGWAQGRSLSIHRQTLLETERGLCLHYAVLNTRHAHPMPGGLAVGPWAGPSVPPRGEWADLGAGGRRGPIA